MDDRKPNIQKNNVEKRAEEIQEIKKINTIKINIPNLNFQAKKFRN